MLSEETRQIKLIEVAEKFDDDHKRIRIIEEFLAKLEGVPEKISEIHEAMVGTLNGNKRGIVTRMLIVEKWKNKINVAIGTILSAIIMAFCAWIFNKV